MYSLQEIVDKTKDLNQVIQNTGTYYPEMMSALEMKDRVEIRETLNQLTLSSLIEVMVRSGATTTGGVAGSNYLFAAKMHDTLLEGSRGYDICPQISAQIVSTWEGADMTVDVFEDETRFSINSEIVGGSSAGKVQARGATVVKCTLSPKTYQHFIPIAADLIEDAAYDLAQYYTEKAGEVCGRVASQWAISRLKNAANGDGTINTSAADAAETKWYDSASLTSTKTVVYAEHLNGVDNFLSDTVLCTSDAWHHSMIQTMPTGTTLTANPGYTIQADGYFNVLKWPFDYDLRGAADHIQTIVFDKDNALLTARKRWLQVDNLFEAPRDLQDIIVSFRQDSTTLYKDAICVLTEA